MKMTRTKWSLPAFLMATVMLVTACGQNSGVENETTPAEETAVVDDPAPPAGNAAVASKNTIKLALLLDTSNSMDGLIEQAKSQLWKIVNTLSEAKKDGEYAHLEIALYEYGNDGLASREGYVRQVLPFTTDLDTISQELFALTTNGGQEYCGEVIAQSLEELSWMDGQEGLQVIVIAGNEPFDQGETSYQKACKSASEDGIFINTIFCGEVDLGIETNWKSGADLAQGYYGNINMDEATVYIETPYDDEINALNSSLNETYIPIGQKGFDKMAMMETQDQNASTYGSSNTTERVIVKGKKHVYDNSTWDLVDASDKSDFDLTKVKTEDLPANMKNMSVAERETYVNDMKTKREDIQAKIKVLAEKRSKYILEKQNALTDDHTASLEDAIIRAIKEQARQKQFVFEEAV